MSIVKWLNLVTQNETMLNLVLRNISFDNISVSYDTLDFLTGLI